MATQSNPMSIDAICNPKNIDGVLEKAGSSRKRRRLRSKKPYNKPYTKEQQDWIRYHREDFKQNWGKIHKNFYAKFPKAREHCDTSAGLSARFYRSNRVPKLDENSQPVVDANGHFVTMEAPVRDREEGHWPSRLVDLHPELVLAYGWVTENSKKKANEILQILDGMTEDTGKESESEFTL